MMIYLLYLLRASSCNRHGRVTAPLCLGTCTRTQQKMNEELIQIVSEYMEESPNYWDYKLFIACISMDREEVDNLVNEKGGHRNWDIGLWGACYGGCADMVDLMIGCGAIDWEMGLWGACMGGHKEIVDLMIACGASNWDLGLFYACHRRNNFEIVTLMLDMGAFNLKGSIWCVCTNGDMDTYELLIDRMAVVNLQA